MHSLPWAGGRFFLPSFTYFDGPGTLFARSPGPLLMLLWALRQEQGSDSAALTQILRWCAKQKPRPDHQGLPESRARWHRHQHTIPAAAVRGIALAPSLPCVRCPQRHSRTGLAMLWLHGRARGLLRHLAGGEASTATSGDTFVLCDDRARSCRSLGFRPRFLCQARTKPKGGWVDAPGGRPTTQDYPHE